MLRTIKEFGIGKLFVLLALMAGCFGIGLAIGLAIDTINEKVKTAKTPPPTYRDALENKERMLLGLRYDAQFELAVSDLLYDTLMQHIEIKAELLEKVLPILSREESCLLVKDSCISYKDVRDALEREVLVVQKSIDSLDAANQRETMIRLREQYLKGCPD